MASLMDVIMNEYRNATPESRSANVTQLNNSLAAAGMTPPPQQPQVTPVSNFRPAASTLNPPMSFMPSDSPYPVGLSTMPDQTGFQYRPSMNPSLAPRMPDETGFQYRPSMNPAFAPRMPDDVGFQYRPSMNPLANPALNQPVVAGLDAANRPAPMASSTSAPARQQGFFEKLFKGPDYQSNNLPVNLSLPSTDANPAKYINWGDPNSAADFFRADALLQQQDPARFGLLGGNNG